ncbi:MAG: ATP synthase F0 subunit C [Candidatus Omnitrophica bacterium]|nr:ATP synthase F0 subunit C [Candidatus Omnitrophota bacterium]
MDSQSLVLICAYISGGLAMGLGAIGPAYGIGMAGAKASEAVARQPHAAGSITKTMLVGQAVSESPAIFALLIAIFLIFKFYNVPEDISIFNLAALIGAGLSTGIGSLGPGVGAGMANAGACEGVGRDPELEGPLLRTMLIGQAVSQSTSVYALVISFCLLFII